MTTVTDGGFSMRNKEFKKGVNQALLFYAIGIILTVLTHIIAGWDYPHAPPPSSIIVLSFFFIGLVIFIISLANYLIGVDKPKNKGKILGYGCASLTIITPFIFT